MVVLFVVVVRMEAYNGWVGLEWDGLIVKEERGWIGGEGDGAEVGATFMCERGGTIPGDGPWGIMVRMGAGRAGGGGEGPAVGGDAVVGERGGGEWMYGCEGVGGEG